MENYKNLTGKSKAQIISELGFEFNHFPSDIWTYELKKDWWGRKQFLVILFEKDHVKKISLIKTYFVLKTEKYKNL
ncbi:hypothetical protein CHRY9390_02438 [Chryseobacterium aquaeductus]|uniref:Uncharacterized protein n=1 Tax=Chryseobacterium aquaeductus TaxID=2675056 RepID=A0A9N8QT40_9FLAO|nr:hypothetical protein [Chryseobacterium aquaeductus]CAA7331724.1 hypothetical protein CHRY9390_02438 [Chryseobacterium potabilaquae]CAD7811929.1 hypothetical protein CHRY9390_02438 [Chryseobacterium aquaeductus]